MPVTEGKYQCRKCEDEFEAKSDKFYTCKCGMSEIKPSKYSYTYKNGNTVDTISQNTYYLEDEFVKLPEDVQKIYDKIKEIKEANGYKYYMHEMFETGRNGEKYLDTVIIEYQETISNYTHEANMIKLVLEFKKENSDSIDVIKDRLRSFLDMMQKVENNEIDISKRSKMIDFANEQNIDYRKESTEEFNYIFYF